MTRWHVTTSQTTIWLCYLKQTTILLLSNDQSMFAMAPFAKLLILLSLFSNFIIFVSVKSPSYSAAALLASYFFSRNASASFCDSAGFYL